MSSYGPNPNPGYVGCQDGVINALHNLAVIATDMDLTLSLQLSCKESSNKSK